MSKSLQEQLMAAGLSDEKKSKAIKKQQRKNKQKPPKGQRNIDEHKQLAEQALKAKADKAKLHNAAINQANQQKALRAQVIQLAKLNRVQPSNTDTAYHFVGEDKKIKKIWIDEEKVDHLSKAKLAIIDYGEGYQLIPVVIAEKILQRYDECFIFIANVEQAPDEDDPYADYQIPDDLMW